jgi:heme-degrading monooxygenase HmoA
MYARIERFNLSQGFAELAEELADRIAPIMRRQSGMRSMVLLADETSGEYIILTHWDTIEHVNAYERSPDEWRVRDIMSAHITTVPVIEVYQVHNLPATTTAAAGAP